MMVRLSEEMIMARTRVSDMAHVKKLNCWGADLSDVTVLRKLRNVEVLSLSVNNITTLADVQDCKNLQELYIRKNKIPDLNEICWLKNLPKLKFLWLEENPAAMMYPDLYRATVIRNLPQLQKLDNVAVQPDEIADAHRRGIDLVHPLDAIEESRYMRSIVGAVPPTQPDYRNYITHQYDTPPSQQQQQPPPSLYEQVPPQLEPANQLIESRRSFTSLQPIPQGYFTEPENNSSLMDIRNGQNTTYDRYEESPPRNISHQTYDRSEQQMSYSSRRGSCQTISAGKYSDDDGIPEPHVGRRYSQQEQSSGVMRRTSPRMSIQASIDENTSNLRRTSLHESTSKFDDLRNANSDDQSEPRLMASSRKASTQDMRSFVAQQYEQTYEQVQQQVETAQQMIDARRVSDYLANFPKRPKNRNSNILSAVLCLIRELDGPSLEVAEMAIKCRVEELED